MCFFAEVRRCASFDSSSGVPCHEGDDVSLRERSLRQCMVRVATWNLAGGLKSDDAPSGYSLMD